MKSCTIITALVYDGKSTRNIRKPCVYIYIYTIYIYSMYIYIYPIYIQYTIYSCSSCCSCLTYFFLTARPPRRRQLVRDGRVGFFSGRRGISRGKAGSGRPWWCELGALCLRMRLAWHVIYIYIYYIYVCVYMCVWHICDIHVTYMWHICDIV